MDGNHPLKAQQLPVFFDSMSANRAGEVLSRRAALATIGGLSACGWAIIYAVYAMLF
jgi:hypothetical protein